MPKFVFLATDIALYVLLGVFALYVWHARRTPNLRQTWRNVLHDAPAMSAAVILVLYLAIALIDSLHFRPLLAPAADAPADAAPAYSTRTQSLLDYLLAERRDSREKTYSVPLSAYQFTKETMLVDGKSVRDFPRLKFGGAHLKDPETELTPRHRAAHANGACRWRYRGFDIVAGCRCAEDSGGWWQPEGIPAVHRDGADRSALARHADNRLLAGVDRWMDRRSLALLPRVRYRPDG